MTTLLWKEMREIGLWAVLLGLGLCAAQAFALLSVWRQYLPPGGSAPTDPTAMIDALYGNYNLWIAIGAPVVGFAIGMLQILPEQRREQWAFLIHRPVGLPQLFWAKSIAGLLAYAAATFIPLALFTGWLLMPGHFPGPFSAVLALPNIASILAGATFYFAGLTVALRPARWWGSRLLPLVAAICGMLLVGVSSAFAAAVLWSLALVAIIGAAAFGSFVAFGEYDGMRNLARIALGTTLLVGATAVVAGAAAVVGALAQQNRVTSLTFSEIEVNTQGRLVQPVVTNQGRIVKVLDAMGRPNPTAGKDQSLYTNGTSISPTSERYQPSYSLYGRYFDLIGSSGSQAARYAFFDNDRGLLSIFSTSNFHWIGYVGRDGHLTASARHTAPFEHAPIGQLAQFVGPDLPLLPFRRAIYIFDLKSGTVSAFVHAPNAAGFDAVETYWLPGQGYQANHVLAVAGDRVVLYDYAGRTTAEFSLREGGALYGDAVVYVLQNPTRVYALLQGYWMSDKAKYFKHPWLYEQVGASGRLGGVQPVEPQNYRSYVPPSPAKAALPALGRPFALTAGFVATLSALGAVEPAQYQGQAAALVTASAFWWVVLWSVCGGLLGTWSMTLLGRRYGRRPKAVVGWAFSGFFLSWTAVLAVLAMIPFPPTARCTSCGKRRRQDRQACEHCGAAQPTPIRDGTEIFEPLPEATQGLEPAAAAQSPG